LKNIIFDKLVLNDKIKKKKTSTKESKPKMRNQKNKG
jgi:hypothetical protein